MRNGIQIWFEKQTAENLIKTLSGIKESKFIKFKNQIFNTADITGIFTANTIEEYNRLRRGQWQDKFGGWHDKFEKVDLDELEINNILNK